MHSNRFVQTGQTAQIIVISCFILQSALLWCSSTVDLFIFLSWESINNLIIEYWEVREALNFNCLFIGKFHSQYLLFDTLHLCPSLPFNLTPALKFCQINSSLEFYLRSRYSFHCLPNFSFFMHITSSVLTLKMSFCLLNMNL